MRNKSKGQSLVEIMMAMVIFGVIAISLSLPVSNSLFLTHDNKNINAVNNLARSYLKEIQEDWKIQSAFDAGVMAELGNTYTDNGKYTVTTVSQAIQTNDDGDVLVRRVNVTYKDSNDTVLCDLYYDYNRPGSV